jgi:hypothetical protein
MVIIPVALPSKIEWDSDNGKWKIFAKVDKEPFSESLYSWLLVQKLDEKGKWRIELSRKHYPAYLKETIAKFETAIRERKKENVKGVEEEMENNEANECKKADAVTSTILIHLDGVEIAEKVFKLLEPLVESEKISIITQSDKLFSIHVGLTNIQQTSSEINFVKPD